MNPFWYGVINGLIVATAFWMAILRTVAKHTKWMDEGEQS